MMLGPILHAPCMRQLCFWFGIDAYEFDFSNCGRDKRVIGVADNAQRIQSV